MNRVAQIMALLFIGIAFTIERDRRSPPPIKMNLIEPQGDRLEARFIGGPLHGEHRLIPNKKYYRVAELPPLNLPSRDLIVAPPPVKEAVYVRTHRSKASGAWLYIYWGKA